MTDNNSDAAGPAAQENTPSKELINFSTSKNPYAKNPTWAQEALIWDDFKAYLKAESVIVSDRSPGPGFVPALLAGAQRRKTAVTEIGVAVVEVAGVNFDEIAAKFDQLGWTGALVSTWANGRTETTLNRDEALKWLDKNFLANYGGRSINPTSIAHYLGDGLGWLDTAETVEIIDENRATAAGAMIVISHDPLPACIVAAAFAKSFRPTEVASTHAAGMKMWPDILTTFEHCATGRTALSKDQKDPAAIIRAPRTRPDSEPVYMEFHGAPLDWTDLGVEEAAEVDPVEKKKRAGGEEWMDRLMVTKEGRVISCLPNILLILENDPRTVGIVAHNEFISETVLRTKPGVKEGAVVRLDGGDWTLRDETNGDLWADGHDHSLRAMLESDEDDGGYNLRVSDRDLAAAVSLTAKSNTFHPVLDYLNAQTWDKTPRVSSLFVEYLGAPDDAYHREVAKLTLMGAVTRVFEPGAKIDESAILEGAQGARKTTFIKALAVKWYGELDASMDDRAIVEQMQGVWIAEMAELTGMAKADIRRIKAFMSRTHDKARLAYAKRARLYPRQYIGLGSTNTSDYLRDPTGGRRFWPVACNIVGTIDIERLRTVIDQLWAEAVHLYKEMRKDYPTGPLPLWLSDQAASATAKELQASRTVDTVEDAMAGQIEAWVAEESKEEKTVCLPQVWVSALKRYKDDYYKPGVPALLGQAMRQAGWRPTGGRETFEGYGQQRAYERVPTSPSPENGRVGAP